MAELRIGLVTIICDDADLPAIVAAGPWRAVFDKRIGYLRVEPAGGNRRGVRKISLGKLLHGADFRRRMWFKNGNRLDYRRENVELLTPGELVKRAMARAAARIREV